MDVKASVTIISLENGIGKPSSNFSRGWLCSHYTNNLWKGMNLILPVSVQSPVIMMNMKISVMVMSVENGIGKPSSNYHFKLMSLGKA